MADTSKAQNFLSDSEKEASNYINKLLKDIVGQPPALLDTYNAVKWAQEQQASEDLVSLINTSIEFYSCICIYKRKSLAELKKLAAENDGVAKYVIATYGEQLGRPQLTSLSLIRRK